MIFRSSPELDLKFEDRLSHLNMVDLLDSFRIENKLESHTLRVKHQVVTDVSPTDTKSEPDKCGDKVNAAEKYYAINYFVYETEILENKTQNKSDLAKDKTEEKASDIKSKRRFAVFYISRDQDEIRNEHLNFLPLASSVIKTFYEEHPRETATLLIPIHQCGVYFGIDKLPLTSYVGFFGLSRDHSVLAEVNPTTKKITIHDSQSSWMSYFYWPSISVEEFETLYTSHSKQSSRNLCGYYVFMYTLSFLRNGNSSHLPEIDIDLAIIGNKENFKLNWKSITSQFLEKTKKISDSPKKLLIEDKTKDVTVDLEHEFRLIDQEDDKFDLLEDEEWTEVKETSLSGTPKVSLKL